MSPLYEAIQNATPDDLAAIDKAISEIYEAIQNATPDDLAAIDKAISEKNQAMATMREEVNKLKALHKTIKMLIEGKPPRKQRVAKTKSTSEKSSPSASSTETVDDRRRKIARLLGELGACSAPDIADELDIPRANINYLLNCESFAKSGQGWNLTPAGRNKYFD